MNDQSIHPPPVKLSVLMPVYNAGKYLPEAIDSILTQTFANFELLILDDGSTDGSGDIIAQYGTRDPRIRITSRENRGLVCSLNELASMAQGEYLARMDADDISLPHRFELQIARLDSDLELDALGGYWTCMDEDGFPIFMPRPPLEHDGIDSKNLQGVTALNHPTVMMRKKSFQGVNGYDERFEAAEDLDLWLRLGERGYLANLETVVLRYRMLETSISGQRREQQDRSKRLACREARRRRGLPPKDVESGGWRPGLDHASRVQFALSWGWQAWNAGNQVTARRYFFKALKISPFSKKVWNALIFGGLRPK